MSDDDNERGVHPIYNPIFWLIGAGMWLAAIAAAVGLGQLFGWWA